MLVMFAAAPQALHYLPLLTTLLCAVFAVVLWRRYQDRGKGLHLLWWCAGVTSYGLGTALESTITLAGNSVLLNKAWYVAGAVLGAYPLAQGSVHLLLRPRTAHRLTVVSVPIVVAVAALVTLSPVHAEVMESHRPTGAILGWSWVRAITPLINGYAALFLIGGAALSAWRFRRKRTTKHRMWGNVLIALGALLPGIGGGMAKAGVVEALYVGELAGILMIWAGYSACVRPTPA
ncbi:MAG: hypothetical protein AAF628_34465 [Planctomycetota bacterium]